MSKHHHSRLRQWRTAQGHSVVTAAAMVPVSRQTWHSWERGERRPTPTLMPRIVEITEGAVTANDFYDLPPAATRPREGAL